MIRHAACLAIMLAGPAAAQEAALELRADTGTIALPPGTVEASPGFDTNGRPAILFYLASDPARAFGEMTTDNVGREIEIVVCDNVLSAPRVMEPILAGSGMISGSFTVEETTDLARRINQADCAGFDAPTG